MKKYIYSPHHQGAVLAPLMVKPDKSNGIFWDEYKPETGEWDFNKDMFNAHMGHYNTWLSSPPIYKVRPEDIEWFSVERGEDEFEVVKRNHPIQVFGGMTYYEERTVAIPKKGNESKEQYETNNKTNIMTQELEKAKELVSRFSSFGMSEYTARQCSLTAINALLFETSYINDTNMDSMGNYWNQVSEHLITMEYEKE
jgi:hypothetical protein